MLRSRLFRGSSSAALLLLFLAGCRDADTPAAPESADHRRPLAAAAAGSLRDDGIDLRDTYFAFTVTTTRSVTDDEPSGGVGIAAVDEQHATDESAYMEAGWDADGALRFNLYSDGAADPRFPPPPPLVRTVGNAVYVYDERGNVLQAQTFNDFMGGVGLPGGDLSGGSPYGSLYTPIDGGGGGGGGEPIQMTGTDPERTRVARPRDDVLEITTTTGGGGIQAAASGAPEIRTTRTFRRRMVPTSDSAGGPAAGRAGVMAHWLLDAVEQTATVPRKNGMATARTRTTYRYVAAHVNPGNDARRERASGAPARSAGPGRAPAPPAAQRAARTANALLSAGEVEDPCLNGASDHVRTVSPVGGGVVYQHGFCSDATTWSAMRQRVPETHRVGLEQAYSLNSVTHIEAQVDDLASRLDGAGAGGNVVVAHSQGGLVARRLGQRRPDLVSGVVTIGTPHEGALIASRPAYVISDALYGAISQPCFGSLCNFAFEVGEAMTAGLIADGVGQLIPAAGDDQPNSPLIQRVNGRSEYQYEQFRRASIAMNVSPRWALFRLIGDARSSRDRLLREEPLKGRRYAADAQNLYNAGRVLRFMAMVLRWRANDFGYGWGCHQSGYASYWEPCYNPSYATSWWEASHWYFIADALDYIGGTVVWMLDSIDRLWDDFTTGRTDGTDGFIQLSSQHYPRYVPGAFPIRRFEINGAEAHTGETASRDVLDHLAIGLDHAGLPRK